MGLIIHVDGGARGNPGPAGAGVVIRSEDGTLLHESAYFLGEQTNNAAEYYALIRALERAQDFGNQPISVCSDSELLVRQVTGEYRVKSANLRLLFEQVQMLLLKISCWNLQHIPREDNTRADELANLAMDRRQDVTMHDVDPAQGPSPTERPPAGPDTTPRPTVTPLSDPYPVRVVVAQPPDAECCPAGNCAPQSFTVRATLPTALCVHAAHAILPTLLAMQNTDPQEFAALPTMTVRCMRSGCTATFHLSPVRSSNGVPRRAGDAS